MDGKEKEPSANERKKLRRKRRSAIGRQIAWPKWTTWLPIVLSIVSVAIAGLTFYVASNPWGRVSIVEEPLGFGIVRGININLRESESPILSHPGDHVLMPLDWINNTGGTVLVRDPTLVFVELDENRELTGEQFRFHMTGELSSPTPDAVEAINTGAETETFTFTTSVSIEPRSVAPSVGVFRPGSWNEIEPQVFRFQPGDSYGLVIEFEQYPEPPIWPKGKRRVAVYERPIKIGASVQHLSLYGEGGPYTGWDYWQYPYR